MPEITVAITTHNLEKYLPFCIQELFDQSFQDFEILIYDDCSSDGTRALLAELVQKYGHRITVVLGREPLRKPALARNAVLDSGLIQGRYLVFLDGDDSIEPLFLEKLYSTAVQADADVTMCAYDRVEEGTGHVLCQEMTGAPSEVLIQADREYDLAFLNASLWNKLIRVEKIGDLRLPDFHVGEDAAFMFALYMNCTKVCCIGDILIHYRVRPVSVISNTPEESVYLFAQELFRLWSQAPGQRLREDLSFASMIHIGIAMPLRMYQGKQKNMTDILHWIQEFFRTQYHWFRGERWNRLGYLLRYGIKGIGIWGALLLHRLHCFRVFLVAFTFVTRVLHIDIKF